MKKTLLFICLSTATTSYSHKLLTEEMADHETFTGFGFAPNIDHPEMNDKVYSIRGTKVAAAVKKIKRKKAMLHYSTNPRQFRRNVASQPSPNNSDWFKYSNIKISTFIDIGDHDHDYDDGHHDNGEFNPDISDIMSFAMGSVILWK